MLYATQKSENMIKPDNADPDSKLEESLIDDLEMDEKKKTKDGRDLLYDKLGGQQGFNYNWTEFYAYTYRWCCCCKCLCCFNRGVTTRDRLFMNGRKKLISEIDLLYIIK